MFCLKIYVTIEILLISTMDPPIYCKLMYFVDKSQMSALAIAFPFTAAKHP